MLIIELELKGKVLICFFTRLASLAQIFNLCIFLPSSHNYQKTRSPFSSIISGDSEIRFCLSLFLRNALIAWWLTCLSSGSPLVEENLRLSGGLLELSPDDFPNKGLPPSPPVSLSGCSWVLLAAGLLVSGGAGLARIVWLASSGSCSCDYCQL